MEKFAEKVKFREWKTRHFDNAYTQNVQVYIFILHVFNHKPYIKPLERNVIYTSNLYILGVFTEKPYSKSLERSLLFK